LIVAKDIHEIGALRVISREMSMRARAFSMGAARKEACVAFFHLWQKRGP